MAPSRLKKQMPLTFEPEFIESLDGRVAKIKLVRKEIEALERDANANSRQKEILCQHAAFLHCWLSTIESNALQGKKFEAGAFVQSINSLLGIFRGLGIEPAKSDKTTTLTAYVKTAR